VEILEQVEQVEHPDFKEILEQVEQVEHPDFKEILELVEHPVLLVQMEHQDHQD
jgi:hypothetical protein